MRLFFTILFFTVSAVSYSQKLTGIWRGTFLQRQPNPFTGEWETSVYKYEVQINQLNSKFIEGVTYSYKQKEFYGKAAFRGLYTKSTKNVLLKETKMLELKTSDNSLPCLMTCYLDYSKNGNIEKLKGTFSSVESSLKNKDCGDGTITLQRVSHSDFKKESFLLKKTTVKPHSVAHEAKPVVKNIAKTSHNPSQKNTVEHKTTKPDVVGKTQPASKTTVSSKNKSSETIAATVPYAVPKKIITDVPLPNVITAKPVEVPEPEILKSRLNRLINTITVNEKDITVDYYDNGEIDGDVISVYDNNRLVINHDTLSTKPLRLNIHSDENNPIHVLITVAENLGTIPPNTCLMVITAGKQRLEVPMASDEKANAKVIIEYKPKEGTKIISLN